MELEERSLEEIVLSKEFQEWKNSLEYEWKPVATKDRITEEDIQDYLW